MSTIRDFNPETDYPTLVGWWERRKVPVMPVQVMPRGWVIAAGGVDIAMLFLYLCTDGRFAVVEWLTTNPACAYSRFLREDVRKLFFRAEDEAKAHGAKFITSFVAPGSGEERLVKELGYIGGGQHHVHYAKAIEQGGA